MNALEEQLREALHRQVDHRSDAPITLHDVRSRAVRIRRTRRLVVAGAAAAAVAVIAPVGVLAVSGDGGGPRPAPPPASDPAVPVGDRLDIRTLSPGDPPEVPFYRDDELVDPDGRMPEWAGSYDELVHSVGGWVGLDVRDGSPTLVLLDDAGAERQEWELASGAAVEPVGALPGEQVVYNTSFEGEGLAMVARPDGATSSERTGPVPGMLDAAGVSPDGVVAGMVSVDDFGSCSAVQDLASGDRVFRTCDHTLGAFSPDGRHLLGHPPYRSGHGDASIAVLTAGGDVVWELPFSEEAPFSITGTVWEDDEHVLAVVYQDRAWRLVRFGVDGTVSAASELVRAGDLASPFRLPPRW